MEVGELRSLRSIFFFQAEDGIRDHCVTGVQTCALPISKTGPAGPVFFCRGDSPFLRVAEKIAACKRINLHRETTAEIRSEERRVGKECRTWRSAYDR